MDFSFSTTPPPDSRLPAAPAAADSSRSSVSS